MAEETTKTAGSLIKAVGRVSQARSKFFDRGAAIVDPAINKMKEAKAAREANNKAIQQRANGLMSGFKNNIDLTKLKPEDEALVKGKVMEFQKQFAEAANIAAGIEDKTSTEYQAQVDIMNGISANMRNLKSNLDNLSGFKADYLANIEAGNYSNAGMNDMSLAQGLTMTEFPIGSISDNGDLNWDSEGTGAFNWQDYKQPFAKANGTAQVLGKLADAVSKTPNTLTDFDKENVISQVEQAVENPQVLASLISGEDLKQFDFSNIDPEDPNAKDQVVDLITKSIFALQGRNVTRKTTGSRGGSSGTSSGSGLSNADRKYNSQLANNLDRMLDSGLPKIIQGVKFTPVPEPFGDFKEKLAELRRKKGNNAVPTAKNLKLDENDFALFEKWYSGEESDQPVFTAEIEGKLMEFTYDKMMEFLARS